MLPDYPKAKRNLSAIILRKFEKEQARHLNPLFADTSAAILQEGERIKIVGDHGDERVVNLQEISHKQSIQTSDYPDIDPHELIREAAQSFADQKAKGFFSELDRAIDLGIGGMGARSTDFSIDSFFEMLEETNIDFDSSGNPIMPSVLVHPASAEKVAAILKSIESDSRVKQRFDAAIERKYREWSLREADRRLV